MRLVVMPREFLQNVSIDPGVGQHRLSIKGLVSLAAISFGTFPATSINSALWRGFRRSIFEIMSRHQLGTENRLLG